MSQALTLVSDGSTLPAALGPDLAAAIDLVHRGGVPSRECFGPRISIAFKYLREAKD